MFYNFERMEYNIRVCLTELLLALDESASFFFTTSLAPSSFLEEREKQPLATGRIFPTSWSCFGRRSPLKWGLSRPP